MPILNLPRFEAPRAYFVHPETGRPASMGEVRFFAPGTTTAKGVYADRAGEIAIGNEIALDAAGSCAVFLLGSYRVEVYDANGGLLFTADNINSIPVESEDGNPGSLIANQNLADLTDVPTARAVLGLEKPTSTLDATVGKVLLVGTLGYGGTAPAPAETDINLIVTPGNYAIATLVGITNIPTGSGGGVLTVLNRGVDRVVQVFRTTAASTGGRTFTRALIATGWTAWDMTYTGATSVGTVAQVSGVPTGALVEKGTNINGRFWKFADGLMMCRISYFNATVAINQAFMGGFRSAATEVTFPAAFVVGHVPVINCDTSDLTAWGVQVADATNTGFNVHFLAPASQSSSGRRGSYNAIGQWF